MPADAVFVSSLSSEVVRQSMVTPPSEINNDLMKQGSEGFEAFRAGMEGGCRSLESLQRRMTLALKRHSCFAWKRGEEKPEQRLVVGVGMAGEGRAGQRAPRLEGLMEKAGQGG